jgi:hypothetical protein
VGRFIVRMLEQLSQAKQNNDLCAIFKTIYYICRAFQALTHSHLNAYNLGLGMRDHVP